MLLVSKKPIKVDYARVGDKDKRWSPSFDCDPEQEPEKACASELHFPHLKIEEVDQGMCGVPSTSRIQWVYECFDFFFL